MDLETEFAFHFSLQVQQGGRETGLIDARGVEPVGQVADRLSQVSQFLLHPFQRYRLNVRETWARAVGREFVPDQGHLGAELVVHLGGHSLPFPVLRAHEMSGEADVGGHQAPVPNDQGRADGNEEDGDRENDGDEGRPEITSRDRHRTPHATRRKESTTRADRS